jgi:hypothetical protein
MNHPGKLLNLTGLSPTDSEISMGEPKSIESEQIENIPEENDNLELAEQHSESSSIELVIQSDPIVNNNSGNDFRYVYDSPVRTEDVKVPESHLMHMNPYPGIGNHQVPINIVRSFAPISPAHQAKTADVSNDIFNDHIQNPYNLTLQIDSNRAEEDSNRDASTVFQSASYFGNDSSDFLMNGP